MRSIKILVLLLTGVITLIVSQHEVSAEEFVVVVNKDNPVSSLSTSMLGKVYRKSLQFWDDGTSILVLDLDGKDPVTVAFYKKILRKSPDEMRVFWIKQMVTKNIQPPRKKSSSSQVLRFVSSNKNAIGYVATSEVDDSVKQVKIK